MKKVLDVCCGSRMFWFDHENKDVIYGDQRIHTETLCDGRLLEIKPDLQLDFRDLPFKNDYFRVVVFDPPHLKIAGPKSWQAAKYGKLSSTWQNDLRQGFSECFRVLAKNGVLIFKWNETQIPTREILALTSQKPLVGHISGKRSSTHWITFLKGE